MELTSDRERNAQRQLEGDPDIYFCILCGRPRRHRYCPVKARGGVDHKVIERATLTMEMQVILFLLGPKRRGDR